MTVTDDIEISKRFSYLLNNPISLEEFKKEYKKPDSLTTQEYYDFFCKDEKDGACMISLYQQELMRNEMKLEYLEEFIYEMIYTTSCSSFDILEKYLNK
jgi:SNF2 family DNA or RNA helicase